MIDYTFLDKLDEMADLHNLPAWRIVFQFNLVTLVSAINKHGDTSCHPFESATE
jgi:hypothetical protein